MIHFKDVSKRYGKDVTALENINFTIDKGSFVFLVGPTGSGKTSIFRLIIRDLIPSDGQVILGDWDLARLPKSKVPDLRRKVGVIFQDLKLLMDRTILENVMLPLEFSGIKTDEARHQALESLASVGLAEKVEKFPLQLSGGERQRAAIARALVFKPEILLADEPTGNLDLQTSFQILDLLESINQKGTTVFMATHNESIIDKTHHRIIVMERGKLIHDKNPAGQEPSLSSLGSESKAAKHSHKKEEKDSSATQDEGAKPEEKKEEHAS